MDQSLTQTFSNSDREKIDLILSGLAQLSKDLHLAKCEVKTAIREISFQQNGLSDSLGKLRVLLHDIDARLHGIELRQQRQNSST